MHMTARIVSQPREQPSPALPMTEEPAGAPELGIANRPSQVHRRTSGPVPSMESTPSFRCEDCRILFPSRDALDNHQRNFCKGSDFHQRLMRKHQESGLLSSEMVRDYLAGAPAPKDAIGLEQMTVEQLRERVARDTEIASIRKAEAAREVERAAAALAKQRARAELQQAEAEARMRAHREAAMQTRVLRHAAERQLRGAELHNEEEVQQKELDQLRQQEQALAEQRQQAERTVARVQTELAELRGGEDGAAHRTRAELLAERRARPPGAEHLSEAAAQRRAQVLKQQGEATRALAAQRQALLAKQRRLEQDGAALAPDLDAASKGGTGRCLASAGCEASGAATHAELRMARLVKQQAEDERRIALLDAQVHQCRSYDASDAASYIQHITCNPRTDGAGGAGAGTSFSGAGQASPEPRASISRLDSDHHASPQSLAKGHQRASCGGRPPLDIPGDALHWSAIPAAAGGQGADGVSASGRAGAIEEELRALQEAYRAAGGGNAQLVELMAKLQADARSLAAAAPATPPAAVAPPRSPLPVPSEVHAHMESIERALAAREGEARELQHQLSSLRSRRASYADEDALSEFMDRSRSRPGSASRQAELAPERELRAMRAKQEVALAQVRHEREMLEEQLRLRKLRDEAEREAAAQAEQREHQAWIADQKRQLIEARVAREVARNGSLVSSSLPSGRLPGLPYSSESGFVVFWDFVSALPRYVSQCTLVYALYDGTSRLGAVKSLPVCDCEPEPGGLARAVLAVRRQFMHTEARASLQLVAELQHVTAPPGGPGMPPQTSSVGWVAIPLFAGNRALKAGFWKLPLLRPPINVGAPPSELIPLEPMKLFLRVVLTADMDQLRSFAVDPDRTAAAYVSVDDKPAENPGADKASVGAVPDGARGATKLRAAVNAVMSTNVLMKDVSLSRAMAAVHTEDAPSEHESVNDDSGRDDGRDERPESAAGAVQVPIETEEYRPDLGVEVRPQRLREWRPDDPVSFVGRLRETGVNPLHVHISPVSAGARLPGGLPTGAGQLDASGSWTVDWVGGVTVRPAPVSGADCSLLVEVFDMQRATTQGYKPQVKPTVREAAGGSLVAPPSASVISWGLLPLFDTAFAGPAVAPMMITGSRNLKLRPPPVVLFADVANAPPPPDDVPSGELQLQLRRGSPVAISEAEHRVPGAQQAEMGAPAKRDNLGVPESAWLNSGAQEVNTAGPVHTFDSPIELFVEGARFLPDDVVVCRARLMLLDGAGQPIHEAAGWCALLGDVRSPKLDAQLVLSSPVPADATVVVSIVAVQKGVEKPRQLGFAALALFHRQYEDPPVQPNAPTTDVVLNRGDFQLPLLLGFPEEVMKSRGGGLTEALTTDAPRVPCATVLLRIHPAGHAGPVPAYASGSYSSSRCVPAQHEVVLYRSRLLREPLVALEAVRREAEARGETVAKHIEAESWMKDMLSGNPDLRFDLTRFAKYNPTAGLQVSVLKAHNLPQPFLSFGVVSLFPPGALYRTPPHTVGVKYTNEFEWGSNLRSPVWRGGPSHLPQVPRDARALIVVEVRALKKLQEPASLEIIGWSVVPAFYGDAVNNGIFQLPLYAGSPPPSLLVEMREGNWQAVLARAGASRAIKLVDHASVEVSILDGQRFGEHDVPEFRPEPDLSLLPGKRLKSYLKDVPSKPLSSLLGGGSDPKGARDFAVRLFMEGMGLK